MLAVDIKFCIANISTGIPFKIHFLIKKSSFFFLLFSLVVEGSEIVGLKIFRSNMQLILYDDGHFTCSVKIRAISFV